LSDDIIDLTSYIQRREEQVRDGEQEHADGRSFFSIWGGEGERSRFALPLWRSVYLAGCRRGALLSRRTGARELEPLFVLDLGAEEPRLSFDDDAIDPRAVERHPSITETDEGVVVHLGVHRNHEWFMLLDDRAPDAEPLAERARTDIMFLAGECAALVTFWGLDGRPAGGIAGLQGPAVVYEEAGEGSDGGDEKARGGGEDGPPTSVSDDPTGEDRS